MIGRRPIRRGFTLPEVIATIVIVGALAAVGAPLIAELSDAHASASAQRSSSESVGVAIERVVRMIREAPTDGSGGVDITTAGASTLLLGNGHRVELITQTLWLTVPGEAASPLLQGVSAFELAYLGADGATDTSSAPAQTQRITIRIATGNFELRSAAWIRVARGQAS